VDDDRADAGVVEQVLREAFQPDPRAALVHEAQLALRFLSRAGHDVGEDLARRLTLARMDVAEKASSLELRFGVAEEPDRRCTGVAEGEIVVEQHHTAPALLDQRAESLLAFFELALRPLALGDVADE